MNKRTFQNCNSCGQGYDPLHKEHILHRLAWSMGYDYSHSTNIGTTRKNSVHCEWYVMHTYRHEEHTVRLFDFDNDGKCLAWQTGCGTTRKHEGMGAEALEKHLLRKRLDYKIELRLLCFDKFTVCGRTTDGKKFSRQITSARYAFNINLWRGRVYGWRGKSKFLLREVYN